MQALFLLPFLASLYFVWIKRPDIAFLNIYLPCTILVPYYYNISVPHFTVISVGTSVLFPIVGFVFISPRYKWHFKRMDLWVFLFIGGFLASEALRERTPTAGLSFTLSHMIEMFVGYVVGRQVIEPDLRLKTIKRVIFLFLCLTPFAFFEYKFGRNLWLEAGTKVFGLGVPGWFVQMRDNTARVATSFGAAILAGMLFVMAFALNQYLTYLYKVDRGRLGPKMAWVQKFRIPMILLPIFLVMTRSRMPMASGVLCFLFLQIPKFRNIRKGATIILLAVAIFGAIGYTIYQRITSGSMDAATSEAQTSAIYRKQMYIYYGPILEEGGWLGWGQLSYPAVQGLGSIDNHYMLIQLAQGRLGLYSFCIIGIESIFTLAMFARKFRSRESLVLVFSLMGAVIAIFVSLRTVYMGEQVTQLLFLLVGWAQSIQDLPLVGANAAGVTMIAEPKFNFKRVIA